jgi:uncharacterized protein YkuJ
MMAYSISGTVSGAIQAGVSVSLTGAATTTVITDSSGHYSFTDLGNGEYAVRPSRTGFTFEPENDTVTVNGADVSGKDFVATAVYQVGGTVAGLDGTVVLRNNGGDDLTVDANGEFTFATELASGTAYAVTVLTQPTGQICAVTNGSGTIGTSDVTDIVVTCAANGTYSISGRDSCSSKDLTLTQDGEVLATATPDGKNNGQYSFSGLTAGKYRVTPEPNPGRTCAPTFKDVTVIAADVTGIDFVAAPPPTYIISGVVSGAVAEGVTIELQTQMGSVFATRTTDKDGKYVFDSFDVNSSWIVKPTLIGYGFHPVSISVPAPMTSDLTNANFVASAAGNFTVGGTVAGLAEGEAVTLQNNGCDDLGVTGTGDATVPFTFATMLSSGTDYAVTVSENPVGKACTVTSGGSGKVGTSDVTNVAVTCAATGTYSISGRDYCSPKDLTLTQDGKVLATATPDTKNNNQYSFSGLTAGRYRVTPEPNPGSTCAPTFTDVTVIAANVTGIDFVAAPLTCIISGVVSGAVAEGVTIQLQSEKGVFATRTTDKDGKYIFDSFDVYTSWIVKPTLSGYDFNPVSISVPAPMTSDLTNANFVATVQ